MRLAIGGLRAPRLASTLLLGMLLAGCATSPATSPAAKDSANHPPRHVFVIILENEPFQVTFGERSPAPYLAHELPKQGALLTRYFATGHYSLDNYISIISGQAPNPETQQEDRKSVV